MNVSEAIRDKRAVRAFRDETLDDDTVRSIVNAGRRAQSAKNDQPWHFIAIRERPVLEALAATSPNIGFVACTGLTVAIVTPPPETRKTILFDAGQAAAYMQLAALERGVVSCLGTVWEGDKARQVLGLPDDIQVHFLIGFGLPRPEDAAPRPLRKGGRRALDEVLHWDRW